LFFGGASCEDVAAVDGEAGEDSGYLGRGFALGENYFGHALAKSAMMVDLGKAQVFKGHVPEASDGFIGGDAPFLEFGE
jgi:hypothetical protein